MTEFVGRTGSRRVYSYPESRRNTTVPFARNFAFGPGTDQALLVADIGTPANNAVVWSVLEAGTSPNILVPITPKSSGIIRISGVLSVRNNDASAHTVQVIVGVDGAPLPVPASEIVTLPAGEGSFVAVPFLTETPVLAPGVTSTVEILAIADADGFLTLSAGSSTLELLEMVPASG